MTSLAALYAVYVFSVAGINDVFFLFTSPDSGILVRGACAVAAGVSIALIVRMEVFSPGAERSAIHRLFVIILLAVPIALFFSIADHSIRNALYYVGSILLFIAYSGRKRLI